MNKCVLCATTKRRQACWWYLTEYHSLSGQFCDKCFEKVRHDSYGRPTHPVAYRNAIQKLRKQA